MKHKDERLKERRTWKRIELHPSTAYFPALKWQQARDHARFERSYVMDVFNGYGTFIGWGVPK